MASGPGFIHLHIHSQYSLLEGALKLPALLDLAKADKQPALGIADTNNLFGALEFSEKASGKGIQPLLGAELTLDFEPASERIHHEDHSFGRTSGWETPTVRLRCGWWAGDSRRTARSDGPALGSIGRAGDLPSLARASSTPG